MPFTTKRRSLPVAEVERRPCTYDLGYVRQDLYMCRKCTRENANQSFAFCAACRYACHSRHPKEVIEIYTKRNFRCDCGNSRTHTRCQIQHEKDSLNMNNKYSHNFQGRYCRCDRPYDPQKDMSQCAMCEDWFHETCYELGAAHTAGSPSRLDVYEMICKTCVRTLPVLAEYHAYLNGWCSETDVQALRDERGDNACGRPHGERDRAVAGSVDLVWCPGFRMHLCRCGKCMQLYRAANAMYIVDRTDFVTPYVEEVLEIPKEKEGRTEDNEVLTVEDDSDDEVVEPAPKRVKPDGSRAGPGHGALHRRKSDSAVAQRVTSSHTADGRMDSASIEALRQRIGSYLRESIERNDKKLPRSEMLRLVSDLRDEVLRQR